MLKFIIQNWKLITAVMIELSVCLACDYHGRSVVQAQWDSEIKKSQIEALTKEKSQAVISTDIGVDYDKKVAAINANYDGYFNSLLKSSTPNVSNVSKPASGNNAAPKCDAVSKQAKTDIAKLMKAAEIQTARLVECQKWIIQQSQ